MEDFNDMDRILKQLHLLPTMQVVVGAIVSQPNKDEDYMEMIAMVNEHGADIKPKNGKYLTIPTPNAGKHKASDFDGLFFHMTKQGKPSLAIKDGNSIKVMFLLSKGVHIPQRSFLRTTFDEHINDDWDAAVGEDVQEIFEGTKTAKELYEHLGRLMVNEVQKKVSTFSNPHNSDITVQNKGRDDPLKDTGALYRAIGYKVISNAKRL